MDKNKLLKTLDAFDDLAHRMCEFAPNDTTLIQHRHCRVWATEIERLVDEAFEAMLLKQQERVS